MKKQYIRYSNEAPTLSLSTYVLWFVALRYFNAPQWLYGVYGVFVVVLVSNSVYRLVTEEAVDVVERN